MTDLEYTALKFLAEAERRQRELGVSVWMVGMNPAVQKVVERSPLGEALEKHGGVLANLETRCRKIPGIFFEDKLTSSSDVAIAACPAI